MSGDITQPELVRWLTRVEGKLDKVTEDHEGRLRRMEKWMYGAIAVVAVISNGLGVLVGQSLGG